MSQSIPSQMRHVQTTMSAYRAAVPIQLMSMPQVAEARDKDDDWTGITDAASRRKRQNRLNIRAYRRRRKALASQPPSAQLAVSEKSAIREEAEIPCWLEDLQAVSILPASVANSFDGIREPVIQDNLILTKLKEEHTPPKIIFPLSSDHLIVLLQFNALRGSIANRCLLSGLNFFPPSQCSSSAVTLRVLPALPSRDLLPPSLHPTILQQTIPHEDWIDIVPNPHWRDSLLLLSGQYDEDELWSDTIGGLFEGFPDSEIEKRGLIAWSPPWDTSGWEMSEGFWRKWGWTMQGPGLEEALQATNMWRRRRGEEPLLLDARVFPSRQAFDNCNKIDT